MKFKMKFISLFSAFAVIPVLLSGGILYAINMTSSLNTARENLTAQEQSARTSFEQTEYNIERLGKQMADSKIYIDFTKESNDGKSDESLKNIIGGELKDTVNNYGFHDNVAIIDMNGKCIVDSQDKLQGTNLSDMDYFTETKNNISTFVSPVKKSITSGNPIFVVAEPIIDSDKKFLGVIIQAIDLKKVSHQFINTIKIGKSGYIYILQKDGTTIAYPDDKEILQKNISNTDFGKKIISDKKGTQEYKYGGVDKLSAYDYNSKLGWIFVSAISTSELTSASDTMVKTLFIIILVLIALSSILAIFIAKSISSPIEGIARLMDKISKGDFTVQVKTKGKDEIAYMANRLNNTIQNIKTSIGGVKNTSQDIGGAAVTLNSTSEQMVTAANEVATAVQEVAKGASEQANELMDVVNLLSNLSEQINEVDSKLNDVKSKSMEAETMATEGTNIINGLIQSIVDVKGSFDTVMDKVKGLSQSVSKIGHITDIINGISEQTNLLALNAAIEAARAGEQGRGFAVVAEEIRKLAEQSKNSSTEIINLVKSVTAETEDVIVNSNNLNDLIENQATSANDTIISFEDIKGSVKSIPAVIEDTHNSLNSAIESKNVVLNKVQNVSAVAEEVSASSEEISASSEEMLSSAEEVSNLAAVVHKTSTELTEEVNVFKI